MKNSNLLVAAAAALALAGCGGQDGNSGGLSAEENQKLDNIAETLDASPDSLVAEEAPIGNGEEAANAQTGEVMVSDEPDANAQ
jgi:hypothetical protein